MIDSLPKDYMPSDDLVERIARELCHARGEEPGTMFVSMVANASGAPAGGRNVTGTLLDNAKRDVRFVLGWINMQSQTSQGERDA